MRTKISYLCDMCNRPAIHFCIDLRDATDSDDIWIVYEPVGEIKSGCALHSVKSKIIKCEEING